MRYASFLFLILLAFQPSPSLSENTDVLIRKTCKNTKYYNLCISSLKSSPRSTKSDIKGLALIMVGIGTMNATATSSYLSSQLLSTTNDQVMKKVLKECKDKYTYAVESLNSSVQELKDESYDYAYLDVSAAKDYPSACRNAFKRYNGLDYPREIAQKEDGLKRICDVVLGIIDLLSFQTMNV